MEGIRNLQDLRCNSIGNDWIQGNLGSLRVLENVLTSLCLIDCNNITGSLTDLRGFRRLETLDLNGVPVTGPLSALHDLSALKKLDLVDTNVMADVHEIVLNSFHSLAHSGKIGHPWLVKDAPTYMRFKNDSYKRNSYMIEEELSLHTDSPGFYEPNLEHLPEGESRRSWWMHPFCLEFVEVGPRTRWQWSSGKCGHYYFETNWLDPQPLPSDDGYSEYYDNVVNETREHLGPFRGLYSPPATETEYRELAAAFIRYPLAFPRNVRQRTK